jgi:hypothetical protein
MNTDEIDKVLINISRNMDLELELAKRPKLRFAFDLLMVVAVYGIIIAGILALMHIVFKAF